MKHSSTKTLLSLFLLISLAIQGCKPNLIAPDPDVGMLRVDRFIAIGDGFTAGFSNSDFHGLAHFSGLYADAQLAAFPRILALQMDLDPDASPEFEQYLAEGNGSGYTKLKHVHSPLCDFLDPNPEYERISSAINWNHNPGNLQINNLGIPYLSMVNALEDSLSSVFFNRITSETALDYPALIREHNPTFFTIWLGTRDLLNYAVGGGLNATMPSVEEFSSSLREILSAAVKGHPEYVRGVIGNIPNVTDFPFFTSIDRAYINIENCQGSEKPIYIETSNPNQPIAVAGVRDRILLPAAEYIGKVYGNGGQFGLLESNPIPDKWVLDEGEIYQIKQRISDFNTAIDTVSKNFNLALESARIAVADLKYLFEVIDRGIIEDGLETSATYLTGGVFSLDGIFLTPRGNAMVANEFIRAINKFGSFGAAIPPVDITDYPGVVFP